MTSKGHKFWETHFTLGPLTFKLRASLAKDFMHSFLGLVIPVPVAARNRPYRHRAAPSFAIVSGLNQVGNAGSQEIRRLFTGRMRTQALTKPRGEGLLSLLHNPLNPSLMAPWRLCLLGCSSLEESYLSLANQSSAGLSRGIGERR